MKHYFIGCLFLFFGACTTSPEASSGFVNDAEDKFQIGSDQAVELFIAFDTAWANRNYDLMKTLIAEEASFEFEDGKIATGAGEFIDMIKEEISVEEASENGYTWTTEYAFSVDLNPSESGEWVNAGFTSTLDNPEDGVIEKVYNEWYYFEKGKLEQWYQTIRKVME
jgi:hypothetical protein